MKTKNNAPHPPRRRSPPAPIIILSDPKAGEDALGRAFNALALARESLQAGDAIPGTPGLLSLRDYLTEGRQVLLF